VLCCVVCVWSRNLCRVEVMLEVEAAEKDGGDPGGEGNGYLTFSDTENVKITIAHVI